ncbi:DUF3302 domain-containing protein [Blastopirellula marina]|uniref:DUF3302 domain-containing protein n=1 Tax=Blastopirellula marina TaxID=124 RepID=A0A2S8F4X9_9BACT|nr:DUF3302 domain-containing protein [Blastopirellula marina]PQO27190.1 hypothetical protein C5Y98_28510 [Blastopirellula marina]PTL41337.1 DUF3302 domain-containing protein [Blastopirellula marina]
MVDFATLFAWFVLAVLFTVIVSAMVALGSLPGNLAAKRNHPHAAAINAASWFGLLFGGVGWVIALVWALIPFGQVSQTASAENHPSLEQQIAALKAEVETLKSQLAQSA